MFMAALIIVAQYWKKLKCPIFSYWSVAQLSWTLCDPVDCSTLGFLVLHCLPEFTQIHVHWVSDAIQPSHSLSPPSPPALNLSQHHGLFQWRVIQVKLYWNVFRAEGTASEKVLDQEGIWWGKDSSQGSGAREKSAWNELEMQTETQSCRAL